VIAAATERSKIEIVKRSDLYVSPPFTEGMNRRADFRPGQSNFAVLDLILNELSIGLTVDAATGLRSDFCGSLADAFNTAATGEIPV
jgi:hypothetical protein